MATLTSGEVRLYTYDYDTKEITITATADSYTMNYTNSTLTVSGVNYSFDRIITLFSTDRVNIIIGSLT